jgi:catechol 2,3-dioxygenase-like lactoylglutathione lyase family enzyme
MTIRGVYEVAIPVRELARAEAFYRDVLGLEVGLRDERRPWVFLRAGGPAGMVVLQETAEPFAPMHFAFTARRDEIERSAVALAERGVKVEGPIFHAWIPATSVYFADPDGHALELCAPHAA